MIEPFNFTTVVNTMENQELKFAEQIGTIKTKMNLIKTLVAEMEADGVQVIIDVGPSSDFFQAMLNGRELYPIGGQQKGMKIPM